MPTTDTRIGESEGLVSRSPPTPLSSPAAISNGSFAQSQAPRAHDSKSMHGKRALVTRADSNRLSLPIGHTHSHRKEVPFPISVISYHHGESGREIRISAHPARRSEQGTTILMNDQEDLPSRTTSPNTPRTRSRAARQRDEQPHNAVRSRRRSGVGRDAALQRDARGALGHVRPAGCGNRR